MSPPAMRPPKAVWKAVLSAAYSTARRQCTPPGPQRPPPTLEDRHHLALGSSDRHRMEPGHRPAASALTSIKPSLRQTKEQTAGPVEPWPPGPPAGPPSYPNPKIKINYRTGSYHRPANGCRE